MNLPSFAPGSIFAERYRIVRPIASGGMGAVYEAKHVVTGRKCAVKVMLGHALDKAELRARFLHEARLAAKIRSAHIVDILDAGIADELDVPYLVMELLEGEDLGQRLLRRGPLTPGEAVTCLWHVATALDKMHRAGVIHRDLKPRNLFATRSEEGSPLYKVVDFGVAKILPREGSIDLGTQNVGTPLYMAPEQFLPDARVGPATDIYALGMIAYMILVGSHYWTDEHRRSENPFAFSRLVSEGPLDSARARAAEHNVDLPAAFDDWFRRATSRDPATRFTTASEAVTELALALDVPAPLVEPDEVTGPGGTFNDDDEIEPVEDQMILQAATLPATASGSSKAAVTVRDVDATEASLSVTSASSRSSRRGPRRVVYALGGLVVLASAAAALVVVRRSAEPSEGVAGPTVRAPVATPPAVAPAPAESVPAPQGEPRMRTETSILTPDTLPLEAMADAGGSAARTPEAPAVRAPRRSVRRAPPSGGNQTDTRVRLYKRE